VNKPFQIITCHTEKGRTCEIIMTYLTEEEEYKIDNDEVVKLERGSVTFEVSKSKIYAYGEIDFRTGSEDYEVLADMTWLNHCTLRGVNVLSNYNYKHNTATSDIPSGRYYDSMSPEVVAQFKHGQLGKPKRTVIFKRII